MFDLQRQIEDLTNKYQLIPRLNQWIDEYKEYDFREYCDEENIPYYALRKVMVMIAIYKRMEPSALIGMIKDGFDSMQDAANAVAKLCKNGFIRYENDQLIVVLEIPSELQSNLDKYQYPLPLVVPPKHLKENTDCGFYSDAVHKSVMLNHAHHDADVCLDHINRINQVKFSLDKDIAHNVPNVWKNINKPKQGETTQEFKKRRRAFDRYNEVTKNVVDALTEQTDVVYFAHAYDSRGRFYVRGYHCNPQGNTWNKATILLANKEVLK